MYLVVLFLGIGLFYSLTIYNYKYQLADTIIAFIPQTVGSQSDETRQGWLKSNISYTSNITLYFDIDEICTHNIKLDLYIQ